MLVLKLLFNYIKTIFCHCDNTDRLKSCDMIIAMQ